METKRLGKQTVKLAHPPVITAAACVGGRKEGEGPLRRSFDYLSQDSRFGAKSWEKAESAMLRMCYSLACDKAKTPPGDVEYVLSGDLLNQCAGSAYAMRDCGSPYFGLYGACSTMAESLSLAAMLIDGGFCKTAAAATSSHFCSAERQYRYPLQYGSQRPPTAQWTVTGAGAAILKAAGKGPRVTHITAGVITDAGVTVSDGTSPTLNTVTVKLSLCPISIWSYVYVFIKAYLPVHPSSFLSYPPSVRHSQAC